MQGSISVVIPVFTYTEQLEVMEYNAALTYKEFADELIIVEDGGRKSAALLDIADVYVYRDENLGFTSNINMGWKVATKDFVFIVNSDTFIESGDPHDLCIEDTVTSPLMLGPVQRVGEFLNGAFFVVPRTVQRGMLDETLKMYYSDDDYHNRVKDIFQQVNSVGFRHIYGATTKEVDHWALEEHKKQDKETYLKKWENKHGA